METTMISYKNMWSTTSKYERVFSITIICLYIVYIFYSYGLQPYFTWDTFSGGRLNYIGGIPIRSIVGLIITVLVFFYIIAKGKINKKKWIFAFSALSICMINTIVAGPEHIFGFEFILYVVTVGYILLDTITEINIYKIFYYIFILALIAPIIIYILVHLGVHIPYTPLEAFEEIKTTKDISYKIYPLAAQWTHTWGPSYYEMRLCGIYNEPGVVGTFSALFLCVEDFKFKGRWMNLILLIGGIFSFSLAFYFIAAIFLVSKIISLKIRYIIVFFSLIIIYIIFVNIPFANPNIKNVQKRITITESGLSGDNRTNDNYDELYQEMYEGDMLNILFGNGRGELTKKQEELLVDGSSYKSNIYDYGVVGFVAQIVWCILLGAYLIKKYSNYKFYIISMVFVYLLNMYQRPSFFSIQYIVFLIGGIQYHIMSKQSVFVAKLQNRGHKI